MKLFARMRICTHTEQNEFSGKQNAFKNKQKNLYENFQNKIMALINSIH